MMAQNDNDKLLRDKAIETNRNSICLNLKKAAKATSSVLDQHLSELGIRASQLSVLTQLSLIGPTTISELADAIVSDRTTLTRNLGPLERSGYVETFPGADRRMRMVALTDRGREILSEALPLREKTEETIIKSFGDENWKELRALIGRLTDIARNL